jgi:uncharacterized protein YbjT (DUF2867 family)
MKTYVILGATGHTGKPAALGLLEKGHTVRIVSRDAGKAADLISKGATHFAVSFTDIAGLEKVFSGADAAYVMIPSDIKSKNVEASQVADADSIAKALEGSGVKHVVALSSIGVHLKLGAGVVRGLQKMEERFAALAGINVLFLRATYFLENGLNMAGMAKHMGIIGSPVKQDIKIPMVASKDIAAVALKHLLALDFTGKGHAYVLGHRDYQYSEIAKIYGKAIGKPDLNYVEFSFDDAKKAMLQMGLGESYTDELLEFLKSMNEGKILDYHQRTTANTTPTSAEEFAHVFKEVNEKS